MLDFYGGRKDLEDGLIRVLHSLSFVEDPTRILRAARFEQRFGFTIEGRTEELISGALDLLDRITGERVRHELELLLAEARPERALCRLMELGVLAKLHPLLRCNGGFVAKAAELRAALLSTPGPEQPSTAVPAPDAAAAPRLYLALLTYSLPAQAVVEFLSRLKIRKEYRDLILEVHALADRAAILSTLSLSPSAIVKVLDETSEEARFLLRVVTDDWLVRQRLDLYQRRLQHVHAVLTGDDLQRMGIAPGPVYRRILERLRAAWLDGEISSRAEEEALAHSVLESRLQPVSGPSGPHV